MSISINNNYLSKDNTTALKGIFAILVVIAHIRNMASTVFNGTALGLLLSGIGYLSVAFFFFTSGYGLSAQAKKNPVYIRNFPKRRLLSFYLKCLVTAVIYLAVDWLIFNVNIFKLSTVKNMLLINGIIQNGWYLQAIMLLYILYYLAFRFIDLKYSNIVIVSVLYFALIPVLNSNILLVYESFLPFILGLAFPLFEEKFNKTITNIKSWILILCACIVLFCVTLSWKVFEGKFVLCLVLKSLSSLLFVLLVLLIVSRVKFNSHVLRFLGEYSFPIYVMHGMLLHLFRSDFVYINNLYLYTSAVIASTIVVAVGVGAVFKSIDRLIKR